jgi:hypothetical protein
MMNHIFFFVSVEDGKTFICVFGWVLKHAVVVVGWLHRKKNNFVLTNHLSLFFGYLYCLLKLSKRVYTAKHHRQKQKSFGVTLA